MKKQTRKRATAASIIAGAMIASSGFLTGCNNNESLYGPPPNVPYSKEDNQLEDVYGPPIEFQEEDNIPEAVYGPPPGNYPSVTPVEFDEDENFPESVYGPPEDFGLEEDGNE